MFSEPDRSYHGLVYTERFGPQAYIERCRSVYLRTTGSVLPALSAFMILQGVETVGCEWSATSRMAARSRSS